VEIDVKENVVDIKTGESFGSNAIAQSVERNHKLQIPTTSIKALHQWINTYHSSYVGISEINVLARSLSEKSGSPLQMTKDSIIEYFRKRQIPINGNA
jgi:hypothetical protein